MKVKLGRGRQTNCAGSFPQFFSSLQAPPKSEWVIVNIIEPALTTTSPLTSWRYFTKQVLVTYYVKYSSMTRFIYYYKLPRCTYCEIWVVSKIPACKFVAYQSLYKPCYKKLIFSQVKNTLVVGFPPELSFTRGK